ncbi:TetR/AcrR family transcriptional regulator [Candidatus Sodalis endolongispinus]|uniref:TetR/AcrR family transcriptional regulator n=1 Tax=Candidatus Sodalis endolongispinus TaxID=2812662 RepID=UPI001C65D7E1|nr:TetR/AcrR family transcriptional regulator [Candidatus Sodalis endolongispinus]
MISKKSRRTDPSRRARIIGMQQLLKEAFSQFAVAMSADYAARLGLARSVDEVGEAIVDIICGDEATRERNLLLSYELYLYGSRQPELKPVMQDWMARSQRALLRFFDLPTARALDTLIEGMTLHHAVDRTPASRQEIARLVEKIIRH